MGFFSSPANLNKITPPSLAFKIRHHHENQKMYAGQLITYTIRPFWNISYEWVTEITAVQKLVYTKSAKSMFIMPISLVFYVKSALSIVFFLAKV